MNKTVIKDDRIEERCVLVSEWLNQGSDFVIVLQSAKIRGET